MSQISTTVEQSKRLLAAGLDPGSADMQWNAVPYRNGKTAIELFVGDVTPNGVPAWSLSRLWDICNDSGIGPFNFGGDNLDSSSLMDKLIKWIIYAVRDYEVLDEYLTAETIQELNRHANH